MPHTDPTDPDDLSFVFPSKPSELATLSDDRLAVLYRKLAFANRYPFDTMVEKELQCRLIAALAAFRGSSEWAARSLNRLTAFLVVLTAVMAVFTIALFFGAERG